MLTIWWCPCVESSRVWLEEGVCYDQCIFLGKTLLVFALLHSIFQGQMCLLLQVFLDFLLLHSSVITHLEPDILECEVKWALESIMTNKARWNSSWGISNPESWCCESAALNMPANLENSPVATGLEKVSFHSNPKERQCQRMLQLPHNCTHLTH